MSLFKSKMREKTEEWLLEDHNMKSLTDGLFVTLSFPNGCIPRSRKIRGKNDLSNREVCIDMLRNLKNQIKNKFFGREGYRGWFVPTLEGNGKEKNFHFHLLISIPDKRSKLKYRDELKEYIENCWKKICRTNWVSIDIQDLGHVPSRVGYICKDITDLTSDCIISELVETNNQIVR
jgi:hypothetical protein